MTIDELWARLRSLQGETFTQIRGGTFTYTITDAALRPDRTDWNIPKGHFAEALELVPFENTVPVQRLFGPSYIYAILTDPRVRGEEW